jgi:hypothetical protein
VPCSPSWQLLPWKIRGAPSLQRTTQNWRLRALVANDSCWARDHGYRQTPPPIRPRRPSAADRRRHTRRCIACDLPPTVSGPSKRATSRIAPAVLDWCPETRPRRKTASGQPVRPLPVGGPPGSKHRRACRRSRLRGARPSRLGTRSVQSEQLRIWQK